MFFKLSVSTSSLKTTVAVVLVATAAAAVWHTYRPKKPQRLIAEIQCSCGQVCLKVDAPTPVHLVCYCDDCQKYAQWVEEQRQNQASTNSTYKRHVVVDHQGGSRTCQVYRRNVSVVRGSNLLQFSYLDPTKVPPGRPQQVFRAHATCCATPICSAFWRELTVMGLYAASFVLHDKSTSSSNKSQEPQFLSPNPTTNLWDDTPHNNPKLPAPEYRINCQYAIPISQGSSTSSTNDTGKKKAESLFLAQGHASFPIFFLLRFCWRNHVVGPKVQAGDFDMPENNDKKAQPVVMRSK